MFDLTALQPFVIGFFVLAALATAVAVTTLVRVAADLRQVRTASPAVSIAEPTLVAAVAGRAA